ncbi:MAG: hypothetical protein CBB71_01070 [Rhodopirellula sp. TMED11]|nr:MAG: hypothetical protein CBB71_01070 [Rhodopirellula sp. TMED11]
MTDSTSCEPDKRTLLFPLFLIIVGVGWLLTAFGIGPSINWVWTLALAAVGVMPFVLYGIDKLTVCVGPFFLIASLLSVLRQLDLLSIDHEMPVLVILAGIVLLIARSPAVAVPTWAVNQPQSGPPSHQG